MHAYCKNTSEGETCHSFVAKHALVALHEPGIMALMKRTIFLCFIRRRIRLPGPCVVLWGKLSGSFVALAPCRALEGTAFLSRVCWRKCISLNLCQHIRLPTYQTVFCSSATLRHWVHSIPFRTFTLIWTDRTTWSSVQTHKWAIPFYFLDV